MKISIIVGKKQYDYRGPKNWQETDPNCYQKLFELGQTLAHTPHAVFLLPQVLFRIDTSVLQFLYDRNAMRMMGLCSEAQQQAVMEQGQALLKICEGFTQSTAPSDWKVPKVKANFRNYYGPGDGLSLLTFEEFWFAEAAYERGDIDSLMGVLYRRDIHRKKPFSTDIIDQSSKELKQLPKLKKEMIQFNYMGCRAAFAVQYRNVFPKPIKGDSATKQKKNKGGWLQIAMGMANDSAMEFDALARQNVLVALQMLDNKIAKVKEFKAKNPKK